jgi:hypothetical protein
MYLVQTPDQHREQGFDAPATPLHYVNDYARVNVYMSADTESHPLPRGRGLALEWHGRLFTPFLQNSRLSAS